MPCCECRRLRNLENLRNRPDSFVDVTHTNTDLVEHARKSHIKERDSERSLSCMHMTRPGTSFGTSATTVYIYIYFFGGSSSIGINQIKMRIPGCGVQDNKVMD